MAGTEQRAEGLGAYRVSTLRAASSTRENSLEGGFFDPNTLVDGSIAFVEDVSVVYRWFADSTAAPSDPNVVIPLDQMLATPGRWIAIPALPLGTEVGQVVRWDGTLWVPAQDGAQMLWGDGALGTGTNDRFPTPGFDQGTGANTSIIEFRMPRNMRTQGFYYVAQTAGADDLVATILKAGVATAHVLNIAAAATEAAEAVTAVEWAAGDRCALLVQRPATASNPVDFAFTLNGQPF